jgi:hypothetical protein
LYQRRKGRRLAVDSNEVSNAGDAVVLDSCDGLAIQLSDK